MCVVSMVGSHYGQSIPSHYPWVHPWVDQAQVGPPYNEREEIEKLKKEILELKRLVVAAKEIDEKTGQKDCQHDDKFDLLKKIAKKLEIDIGV